MPSWTRINVSALLTAAFSLPIILLSGCAVTPQPTPPSTPEPSPAVTLPDTATPFQTGIASWYGEKFHGQPTASGEIFNQWSMTAAHRSLPLGTKVIVEHRRTKRRVTVKINDRGPFIKGRIIDLARGAASKLNIVSEGTAPVHLYLARPDQSDSGAIRKNRSNSFSIQVGSFKNRANARQLHAKLSAHYDHVRITTSSDRYYRVRIGRFETRSEAHRKVQKLQDQGYETWIVRASP